MCISTDILNQCLENGDIKLLVNGDIKLLVNGILVENSLRL